jgi:hypothetical protein
MGRLWLFVAALGVLGLAACGGGAPDEPAPLGLDTISLPDDRESVLALFDSLPAAVGGLARGESDPGRRLLVPYGPGKATYLSAAPLETIRSRPGDGPADVFAEIVESGVIGIEEEETSTGARVVYVLATTVEDGRNSYVASWADPGGEWVFAAQAFSAEQRAALIEAFVAAAAS